MVSCGTFGICACFPAKPLDLNSKLTGGLHDVSGLGMPQDATREAKNIGHNIFLDFCNHDLTLGKKMMMDGWMPTTFVLLCKSVFVNKEVLPWAPFLTIL